MILTFGTTPALARSMIFERLTLDAVNRAVDVRVAAAGKSVNVARVLRTLGQQVACTGIVGGDTGRALVAELTTLGASDKWVWVDAPTRVCVTVIDRSRSHATELVEEAPPAPADVFEPLMQAVRESTHSVLVCSGTIARGLPDDLYARAAGVDPRVVTIVDATGPALRHAASLPVIVKCNASEATQTFGSPLAYAIEAMLSSGVRGAVISDGPRPTTVATRTGWWMIKTPRVPVVSPIGSGDAMAGGLAAGIERGWAIEEAARLGVACAAANVQTPIAGLVTHDEVDRVFQRLHPVRTDAPRG